MSQSVLLSYSSKRVANAIAPTTERRQLSGKQKSSEHDSELISSMAELCGSQCIAMHVHPSFSHLSADNVHANNRHSITTDAGDSASEQHDDSNVSDDSASERLDN
jgi:hypothetical protein